MLAWGYWGPAREFRAGAPVSDTTATRDPDWKEIPETYDEDDELQVPRVVMSKGRTEVAVDCLTVIRLRRRADQLRIYASCDLRRAAGTCRCVNIKRIAKASCQVRDLHRYKVRWIAQGQKDMTLTRTVEANFDALLNSR